MAQSYTALVFLFLMRFGVLAILIKSSLEVVLVNDETPRLIVTRIQYWLSLLQKNFYIDQDPVLRVVMKHQKTISLAYGFLVLNLCLAVVANIRILAKPLIWTIVTSAVFFYADVEKFPFFLSDKLKDITILLAIVAGLYLINGFNPIKPLIIQTIPD